MTNNIYDRTAYQMRQQEARSARRERDEEAMITQALRQADRRRKETERRYQPTAQL